MNELRKQELSVLRDLLITKNAQCMEELYSLSLLNNFSRSSSSLSNSPEKPISNPLQHVASEELLQDIVGTSVTVSYTQEACVQASHRIEDLKQECHIIQMETAAILPKLSHVHVSEKQNTIADAQQVLSMAMSELDALRHSILSLTEEKHRLELELSELIGEDEEQQQQQQQQDIEEALRQEGEHNHGDISLRRSALSSPSPTRSSSSSSLSPSKASSRYGDDELVAMLHSLRSEMHSLEEMHVQELDRQIMLKEKLHLRAFSS